MVTFVSPSVCCVNYNSRSLQLSVISSFI